MAMFMLIEKFSKALDRRECVIGVFLDFSKAFDTVDHKILPQKLERYGVSNASLKWFESNLSKRTQYFFLLYILSSVSEYSVLFADDTNAFISGENINVLCIKLNEELGGWGVGGGGYS